MRRLLLLIMTAGLFAFGACSPAAPETGDPTVSPAASPSTSPTPSPSPSARATASPRASDDADDDDDESVEEQDDDSSAGMTAFGRTYTYRDGVAVKVTKIKHGTVTAQDVAAGADEKKGTPWVQLTVRVTNGSKLKISELVGDFTLSYGPDKDDADQIRLESVSDKKVPGSIRRGKAEVMSSTFTVPLKDQDDVVLEFTPDIDHDSAYFSGSIA